jgi:glycine/D-amino acid oxidase-like deaminating enzyme/nitrite reductase/ring-hydroxylating ferredoxin subunit
MPSSNGHASGTSYAGNVPSRRKERDMGELDDTGMAARSLWAGVEGLDRPALTRSDDAEVCVVGAGIAGLSTAYCLARQGKDVIVLDDGPIAGGMTRHTTAHLSNAIDDRYVEIERLHGADGARFAAESHGAAIDFIEAIAEQEGIACDFARVDGYLSLAPDMSADLLERELAAARRAGLADVELLAAGPESGLRGRPCLRFPRQGQFHPVRYLAGLARAFERLGGQLYCRTHVSAIDEEVPTRVTTTSGLTITARAVVIATNTPINDRIAIHTKQAPYSTYVIAARVPPGAIAKALYWDTADPYHYVRLHAEGERAFLIVGGEDHKSGQADDGDRRLARLEQWMREQFPAAGAVELRWSGQVMETADGLGFIGRDAGNGAGVYIATGDSGMGMTHGTIAGILITDLILGRSSPWATLYDPSRKMFRAPLEYAKENLNVARRYLMDYLRRGDVASTDELAPGSGAIIRRGAARIAAFRDVDGTLHERSAVCPHLGCIVQFDAVEKTWDCPCHGSRFDRYGRVIVGPANRDLAVAPPEQRARKTAS